MKRNTTCIVLLLVTLVFAITCGVMASSVSIRKEGNSYNIHADAYEAVVASDGHLTNLRVAGSQFLMSGAAGSRGTYFMRTSMEDWANGHRTKAILNSRSVVDISTMTQPDASTISAAGSDAAITYCFSDNDLTLKLANRTAQTMRFEVIIDPRITYAITNAGKVEIPFVEDAGSSSSWVLGKFEVKISGNGRLWGPWADKYQVWQADLNGSQNEEVTLSIGPLPSAHAAMIANIEKGRPADYDGFSLYSPMNCQVFQRQSRYQGSILISGRTDIKCDSVEYRLSGKPLKGSLHSAWTKLALSPIDSSFFQKLPVPAGGWYKLEMRALLANKTVYSKIVEKVGVGEVFVTAGQSNSTNCGQFPSKQTSGMVSCFSGEDWQVRDDPFTGTYDKTGTGSPWPAFGDAMYKRFKVPIGVAATGAGGTSVGQWIPGGEPFNWTVGRIKQLGPGGFRAVLWHQGESDYRSDPDWYYSGMSRLINASKLAAGWSFPWFTAQASYHPNLPSVPGLRAAQKKLWDTGLSLEGPDTDTLTGDYRANDGKGIHLSLKGLKAHGELWAQKVGAYLDTVLDN